MERAQTSGHLLAPEQRHYLGGLPRECPSHAGLQPAHPARSRSVRRAAMADLVGEDFVVEQPNVQRSC